MKTFQHFFEDVMAQLFLEVTAVQRENISKGREINFDYLTEKIKCELSDNFDIPLE